MSGFNVNLNLSLQGFEKSAQKAIKAAGKLQNDVDKIKEKVEKTKPAWASFVGNLGASAFIGAARGLGTLGASLINSAAKVEDLTTQFKVLTGSSATAKKTMEDLQNFAATTPFQLDGLASTAQTLLAFGFNTEQLIPKLQSIGDVAAATGNDVKEIGLIFSQVSAAGKLTGERLLQLQERGIPILSALGDSLGTTQAAARDMITKGKIDFATFEKAFDSLSAKGGIAFEGMIQKSKTYTGVVSTMKDNIFNLSATLGKELLPYFKAGAIAVTNMAASLVNSVKWVKENWNYIKLMGTVVGTTTVLLNAMAIKTALASGATKAFTIAQAALNTVMSLNPIGLVVVALAGLVGAIVGMIAYWEESKVIMNTVYISFLKLIEENENLAAGFLWMRDIAMAVFNYVGKKATELWGWFSEAFGGMRKEVQKTQEVLDVELDAPEPKKNSRISELIAQTEAENEQLKQKIEERKALLAEKENPDTLKGELIVNKEDVGVTGDTSLQTDDEKKKLEEKKNYFAELQVLQMEHEGAMTLAEQEAEVARAEFRAENKELTTEQRLTAEQEALDSKYEFEEQKLEIERNAELARADLIEGAYKKAQEKEKIKNKFALKEKQLQSKKELDMDKQNTKAKEELAKEEEEIQRATLQATSSFLKSAQSLMGENSKEAKALAIVDATIQTYLGATRAMATVPYPANFIAAGSVIAAGIANVAKITSSGNFADGGVIPQVAGRGIGGDNLTANVNPNEVILNSQQQANLLFKEANSPSSGGGDLINEVRALRSALENRPVILVADDTEIARSASRGVINGIIIGESN